MYMVQNKVKLGVSYNALFFKILLCILEKKNHLHFCIRKTFIYKWPQNLHFSSLDAKTFIKLGSEVI